MHAYSAIPDIEADKKAKLATVATYCGKQWTLQFCLALYLFAAINTFVYLWRASIVWWLVYSWFMIVSFYEKDLMDIYKIFPRVNTIIGMIIFFVLLFWQIIH
jgi:4-hydroxybenzoate polyprenyltransferase